MKDNSESYPSTMTHAYNPKTRETKAGELQLQDQPELNSKILSQNKQTHKYCLIWWCPSFHMKGRDKKLRSSSSSPAWDT